jgi:hypothetical protein
MACNLRERIGRFNLTRWKQIIFDEDGEIEIKKSKKEQRIESFVDEHVGPALEFYHRKGIRPSLRTLFYRLVGLEVLGNTQNTYKRLSEDLVEARKSGLIRWDAIADNVRYVVGDYEIGYRRPEDHVQSIINYLKRAEYHYQLYR